jgi:hypothetical protein
MDSTTRLKSSHDFNKISTSRKSSWLQLTAAYLVEEFTTSTFTIYSTVLHYYRKTNLKKRKGLCFYKSALLTSCGLQTTVLRKYPNVLDTNNFCKVLWEKNRFVRQSNDTLIYWNWFSWRKRLGFHSLHTVSLTKEQAAVTCKVPFQTKELAKDVKLILKFGLEERINWDRWGYVHILSEKMWKSFDLKVADNSRSNKCSYSYS